MSTAAVLPLASPPSRPDNANPASSNFLIAFRCLAGQSYIINLIVPSRSHVRDFSNESRYVVAIREQLQHFKTHESFLAKLFGKHQLGSTHVRHRPLPDSTASCACYHAYLSEFTYNWRLTKFVLDPHYQVASAADTDIWDGLPLGYENGLHRSENALTVRRVIDKTKVMWLTGSLAALAPLTSILLGVYTHNTEAAIALFAGVLALASFVQSLATFFPD